MLVARQCEPLRHSWSSVKLGSPFQEEKAPRMSNLEPITSQSEWRDSYAQDWQATENLPALTSLYDQPITTHSVGGSGSAPLYEPRPSLHHRHSLAQVESRQQPFPASHIDRSDSAPTVKVEQQFSSREQDQQYLASGSATLQESHRFDVKGPERGIEEGHSSHQQQREDDDEHEEDDDEMLDAEERVPGDGRPPQTEAERRAERRKMKRFRLTHQQTRFLMSEFAKQAHPDAAHRERLSREIPGLSPRQVQVWFQNRRAKIKRLHADDRERMMKMRAVPEGFDTVQALHSPYGSYPGGGVQVVGPPMHSMEYLQNHGDYGLGLRPLMVDPARRPEHDEHISSVGLSSQFGQVGYAQPPPVGTTDMLSSLSSQSGRYFSGNYPSQLPSGQHRDTGIYSRHNSMDSYAMQNRQGTRPIQPLKPLSRSRSDSLQSPLGRTSMSWKGDTIDYGTYQQPQTLSPSTSIRQAPLYQGDLSSSSNNPQPQYSNDTYAATNIHTSPQNTYSINQTSQPENPPIPRFRSASAAFPSTLNLQNPYRPNQSPNSNQPSISHTGITSTSPSSYTSAYNTGGFQSAPLLPAAEFQMPRTPDIRSGENTYQISHLSGPMTAPMAAPQDFNAAYQAMSPPRPGSTLGNAQESHPGESGHSVGHNETAALSIPHESEGQETQHQHQHQHGQHQSEHYVRHDGYGQPVGAPPSRKRTFSMSENYEVS